MKLPKQSSPLEFPPLSLAFYLHDTAKVARDLIGKVFVFGKLSALITETEAYLSQNDPASHSQCGPTQRNRIMFEEGGHCYVYRSYGIHFCANIVTAEHGIGEAVLIRSAIPVTGVDQIQKNRRGKVPLLEGPGRFCQGMGIDLKQNGLRLNQPEFKIIDQGHRIPASWVEVTPRIGITRAVELPLRFVCSQSRL